MNLDKALRPDIRFNIVKFFHENQASIDTPRGVAAWIDEDRGKVKKALEELTSCNVLIAHRSTSTTGYSYTRDPKLISKIVKLLKKRPS